MKGTAASALQVERNELPMQLRWLHRQIKLAVKVKSSYICFHSVEHYTITLHK